MSRFSRVFLFLLGTFPRIGLYEHASVPSSGPAVVEAAQSEAEKKPKVVRVALQIETNEGKVYNYEPVAGPEQYPLPPDGIPLRGVVAQSPFEIKESPLLSQPAPPPPTGWFQRSMAAALGAMIVPSAIVIVNYIFSAIYEFFRVKQTERYAREARARRRKLLQNYFCAKEELEMLRKKRDKGSTETDTGDAEHGHSVTQTEYDQQRIRELKQKIAVYLFELRDTMQGKQLKPQSYKLDKQIHYPSNSEESVALRESDSSSTNDTNDNEYEHRKQMDTGVVEQNVSVGSSSRGRNEGETQIRSRRRKHNQSILHLGFLKDSYPKGKRIKFMRKLVEELPGMNAQEILRMAERISSS